AFHGGALGQHGLLLRHLVRARPAERLRAAAARRDSRRPDPIPALRLDRVRVASRPADPGPLGVDPAAGAAELRGGGVGPRGGRRADRPRPALPSVTAAMNTSLVEGWPGTEVAPARIEPELEHQRRDL